MSVVSSLLLTASSKRVFSSGIILMSHFCHKCSGRLFLRGMRGMKTRGLLHGREVAVRATASRPRGCSERAKGRFPGRISHGSEPSALFLVSPAFCIRLNLLFLLGLRAHLERAFQEGHPKSTRPTGHLQAYGFLCSGLLKTSNNLPKGSLGGSPRWRQTLMIVCC